MKLQEQDGSYSIADLDPRVTPFVDVDDAARLLGIGRHALYRAIREGRVPSFKVTRRVRVPVAWLRQQAGLDPVPS